MFEAITVFYKDMPEELKRIMKEADPKQVKELENMIYIDDNKVLNDPAVTLKMVDDYQRGMEAIPFIFSSLDKYKDVKDLNTLSVEQKTKFIEECREQINAIVTLHKASVEFGKMADFIRKHKDEIMKEDTDEKED